MWLAPAVLILAVALAAYILIGYPLLLAALSSRPPKPVAKSLDYTPTVTLILAVYNGAEYVRDKIESILKLDYPREQLQILVVSDGSTDRTEPIVREFAGHGVQLLVIPHSGKAAAINTALAQARGEILFFTDVRQKLDPAALRHLAANFADPRVGAVSGELRILKGVHGEQADMDLYWRYELWVRKIHSSIDSIFTTTGCIYALRRSLASQLPVDTLTDDAVLPLNAYLRGYRILFEPAAIAIDYPTAPGHEFLRRCRTLAGLWQVFARMPQVFAPGHPMWLHFSSHKLARLALPWALILIVLATSQLPAGAFRTWMLADEGVLVLLAAIDAVVPRRFPLKRITSPARTFLTMNAASIAALGVFFVPAGRFWQTTRVESVEQNDS